MRTSICAVGLSLLLVACATVRQKDVISYTGNHEMTVAALEAELTKRGHTPVCREAAYCKFQFKPNVWIHFKMAKAEVVVLVDVTDGQDIPAAELAALQADANKVADQIWASAKEDAGRREGAAVAQAKADAAAEAERDAAAAAEDDDDGGGGLLGALQDVGNAMDSVNVTTGNGKAPAPNNSQTSGSARCCINGAYYECPSAAAVNKCSGNTSRCLMGCMNSSNMSCADQCLRDFPPDPSDCTRASSNDNQCKK